MERLEGGPNGRSALRNCVTAEPLLLGATVSGDLLPSVLELM